MLTEEDKQRLDEIRGECGLRCANGSADTDDANTAFLLSLIDKYEGVVGKYNKTVDYIKSCRQMFKQQAERETVEILARQQRECEAVCIGILMNIPRLDEPTPQSPRKEG